MTTSDPLDDQASINKLEAIISDHNKAMRITVKALIGWHLQKCRSYLVEKVEGAPIGEYETGAELDAYADGFNAAIDQATQSINNLTKESNV